MIQDMMEMAKGNKPPRWASWILFRLIRQSDRYSLLDDLEIEYRDLVAERGRGFASFWFIMHGLRAVPELMFLITVWRMTMLMNYFKIAFRNIARQKGYSFINIMGLVIGITCSVFILLYIQFELSYDKYHKDSDRIFRIAVESNDTEYGQYISATAPRILVPIIKQNYPEVEHVVRIWKREYLIKYGEESFYDDTIIFADSDIFKVFSILLIVGDPSTALERPNNIIITKNIANKYFGNKDPVGEIVNMDGDDYLITGIAKNPPGNTHFKYSILVSIKTIENDDMMSSFYTYIKLKENVTPEAFEDKIRHIGAELENKGRGETFFLQSLTSIHLHSHTVRELEVNSNPVYLYIFSAICVLILLIGCINFINLTTARAAKRTKEIGIRKVVGAARAQLSIQLLGDSFLFALIAALFAFMIVSLSLPYFSALTGIDFHLSYLLQPAMMMTFIGILLTVGFVAGSYPAIVLSGLKPIKILKGMKDLTSGKSNVRKALVVGQFTISISLIICSLFIHKQLHYVQNMYLGFDKEQKLIIPVRKRVRGRAYYLQNNFETVKNEFMNHASISGTTVLSIPPGSRSRYWQMIFERGGNSFNIQVQPVDIDFIREYDIKMAAGRPFQRDISTDGVNSIVINRAAAKAFGFSNPEEAINQKIIKKTEIHEEIADELNVIGVVDDFNYYSLKSEIQPAILLLCSDYFKYISLTVNHDNLTETLSFVKMKWAELFPGRPFEYYFLDDYINSQFRSEEQIRTIFGVFTGMGIFVACLGLFGLAAFTAEQRTKEIGIRKVLGSSVVGVVILLTKEFTKWVLLANLFAWPIAYIAVTGWLKNFAYRVNIEITVFLISTVSAMAIALLTVGYQAIKAARANPVQSLRYE